MTLDEVICDKCRNQPKVELIIESEIDLSNCVVCREIQNFLSITERQQLVLLPLPSCQTEPCHSQVLH